MMWMLLDHRGQILRTGEEEIPHIQLGRVLEERYPGIRTAEVTIAPWRGLDGEPMRDSRGRTTEVACVWLAVGSPHPDECADLRGTPIINLNIQGWSDADIDPKTERSDTNRR